MKRLFFFSALMLCAFALFAAPWGHRYITEQTWIDTTVDTGTSLTFSVEWGEGDWTNSDLGYGTSTDGTGWTWTGLPWFEDGSGSNKRCKTDVTFNTTGTYYYAYRMEKPQGTYSYQHGSDSWSENVSTLAATHKVTVENPLPVVLSQFNAVMINHIPTINWLTQSENNNFGWNIYRSVSENFGQSIKINSDIISGAGTTNQPTRYVFKDNSNIENSVYYYWLESIDYSGATILSNFFKLNIENNNDQPDAPSDLLQYGLHQNYPNPFNPDTQISFILQKDANVNLSVYNLKGEKIKTLLSNKLIAKNILNSINWDGTSDNGKKLTSGLYFYKLTADKTVTIKKMLMAK